jgi:nucleoid DNA-binding protein
MLSNRIDQLTSPPRPVPLRVAFRAMLGLTGALGAIFLLFGMFFVWIFVGDLQPIAVARLALSTTTAEGVITNVDVTNATENGTTVYVYEFTFRTRDEREYTGRSYTTGQRWRVEDRVEVEYVPGNPTIARIEGARRSQFSPTVLFVFLFPGVGAALFTAATVRGLQQVMLLRSGRIAGAEIISEQATGTRINNAPVIAYVYEFEADDGESYLGKSKSLPSGRIGDETQEPVLYLSRNPKRSTLVDAIPLRHPLDVDEYGQWQPNEGMWPIVWYTLIWMGIAANAVYALTRALGQI